MRMLSAARASGRTLPMVAGLLVMSLLSGAVVGRSGRSKIFPVLGSAVMALGLYLLSRLDAHTASWQMAAELADTEFDDQELAAALGDLATPFVEQEPDLSR